VKIVINRSYGGFSLSDTAYEKLIERGIPVKKFEYSYSAIKEEADDHDVVIFDRHLDDPPVDEFESANRDAFHEFETNRYWDQWSRHRRSHPLLVSVILELGTAAAGAHADLEVIEIPDDVKFVICGDYGREYCAEERRVWGRDTAQLDK